MFRDTNYDVQKMAAFLDKNMCIVFDILKCMYFFV